jgi:hypothetical protein
MNNFEMIFGCKSREYTSPLVKGDYPEIDTTTEIYVNGINKYQAMAVCLYWAVSLERFDIHTASNNDNENVVFSCCPSRGSSGPPEANVWMFRQALKCDNST